MMGKDLSKATLIFGTTQVDPLYAAKLIHMFPGHKKILVDGFCERALPCSEYSHLVQCDTVWHLDTPK